MYAIVRHAKEANVSSNQNHSISITALSHGIGHDVTGTALTYPPASQSYGVGHDVIPMILGQNLSGWTIDATAQHPQDEFGHCKQITNKTMRWILVGFFNTLDTRYILRCSPFVPLAQTAIDLLGTK